MKTVLEWGIANKLTPFRSYRERNMQHHSCKRCDGEGQIQCPVCDGRGTRDVPIQDAKFDGTEEHCEELYALQDDARRAIRQAEELSRIQPARADSYTRQLESVLEEIENQVDKIQKGKP